MNDLTVREGYAIFYGQWPSNWESSPFTIDGTEYSCVEQYMMAEKARLMGDKETLKKIMRATNPRDQKRLGRQITPWDERKWASARYEVVLKGTVEKYRQNSELLSKLRSCKDLTFVEASPTDTIWGIGMHAMDPDATRPGKWRGDNLLGKAINEARRILIND